MIKIFESLVIESQPEAIYEWICDIEAYKEWIPYCSDSGVISIVTQDKKRAFLEMQVGFFKERLVTDNTYWPCEKIEMNLYEGKFQSFQGQWTLHPLSLASTEVRLNIEAELKPRFLETIAQGLVQHSRLKILEALRRRFFR